MAGQIPRWNESPAVETQVEALLQKMTLDDKVNLVSGKLVVDDFGNFPPLPDGLPELLLADGPAGVRIANPAINERKATALPAPIALAATWEPELAWEYGDLLGAEAAATSHNVLLGPAVDIARAPFGGRTFESFGEDPLLQVRLVAPEVEAIQSHPVAACIKHYLANNQEYQRNSIDVQADERTLQEIYLPPFAAAVREGRIAAVMGSYNRINGTYACENYHTLTEMLRDQLGFRGFVMSDFMAAPSTAESIQAGLDWELGTKMWGPKLPEAVRAGKVPLEALDEMARRILRPILGLGLADHPREVRPLPVQEHSARARAIAEQGVVLLKNTDGILPFSTDTIHSIAIIGPEADNISAAGGGSACVQPTCAVSVLDGIRQRAGQGIRVEYAPGVDPIGPGVLLPGLPAIPSDFFRLSNTAQAKPGLRVEYWNNPNFDGEPCVTRIEPRVELNYGFFDVLPGFSVASPKLPLKPAVLKGRISARWTGYLTAPVSGEYKLSLTCLGTARLYLNGQLFMDSTLTAPEAHLGNSAAKVYSASVSLVAGESLLITIEYAADAPGNSPLNEAMLRLGWQPPAGLLSPSIRAAVALAEECDIAVVVVRTYESEEMDRPGLRLPNEQDSLIRAVAEANPRTIVVLMNAGPVEIASWESNVPAILESWFAGQEQGNVVARVLFGDVNPSGRLPLTFPRSEAQTPVSTPAQYPGIDGKVHYSEGLFVGYRGYDHFEIEPQYPFGYGLSYTHFEYSRPHLTPSTSDGTQNINISFELANTGNRAGIEVAQVYLGLPASVSAPMKRLAGWARLRLEPGERRQVTVTLDPQSPERPLSFWNPATQDWEIADGDYSVHFGASARDIRLTATHQIRKV